MLRAGARIPPGIVGSSPLTRGKPRDPRRSCGRRRLIPAHAGKTWSPTRCRAPREAHPRSRGENAPSRPKAAFMFGSSPLTRGKHQEDLVKILGPRLIPAHAGKTGSCYRAVGGRCGSSPLTRGKPVCPLLGAFLLRLIPAHAGKTGPLTGSASRRTAHPRSRGENELHH